MVPLEADADGGWIVSHTKCPECKRLIIRLLNGPAIHHAGSGGLASIQHAEKVLLVRPKGSLRPPCPKEVPKAIAEDYNEACLVLADSAKASAALSRRCLQNVLRETAKAKPRDLFDEIQEVLDGGKVPPYVAEGLDAVRAIGNFAAHPIKSKHSGEVIPVEPGEAEWNLDVLESLFDFYYVQPALHKAKKDALNKKLAEAGKPAVR
jgi:uncharacterized protein DUF4145